MRSQAELGTEVAPAWTIRHFRWLKCYETRKRGGVGQDENGSSPQRSVPQPPGGTETENGRGQMQSDFSLAQARP